MTLRKKPTRAERKARKEERHEIVRSIMQEPDDVVFFPVAYGRIAMSAAVWGSVALGVLALGVLASAVFLMRDEITGLGKQLQQKDVDLVILSGELQKVRDQMFGEQVVEQQGKTTLRLVDAETGVARAMSGVTLKDTPYPLGPESRTVNGKFLYWTDEEGILRVNLEDGTTYRVVTKPFISSLAVSKDGSWLAYAYSQGLSDPESVGKTQAVAMPLTGRGDPIELGVLMASADVPKIHGFSDDGKELLWVTRDVGGQGEEWTLHRKGVLNGQEGLPFKFVGKDDLSFIGFSPDGTIAVAQEFKVDDYGSLVFINTSGKRTRPYPSLIHYAALISWGLDGSTLIVEDTKDYKAVSLKGSAPLMNLGGVIEKKSDGTEIIADPSKFLLVVRNGSDYMFRNLSNDAIASMQGSFTDLAGYSTDLNAVVLLENIRE